MIHAVREEDQGKYTCEATNDGGARQVTVELTVEGEFQEARAVVGDELSVFPRSAAPASVLSWAEEKPPRESMPIHELRTF